MPKLSINKLTKNLLSNTLLLSMLATTAMFASTAHAEPTGYNQLSFNVTAEQEVENDEVTATLYKKVQSSNPSQLATELNTAINQALATAKYYPTVTATTGSQNTYPRYDDDGKITGWTGSVSIDLKSNDFAKTGELIANLQETMVMQNLQFGVSKEKQKQVEQALIKEAALNFKQQASSITETWDMSGYRLINVSINTNNHYYPISTPRMMLDATSKSAVPEQSFEGGNSNFTVTANGTIELIPWVK